MWACCGGMKQSQILYDSRIIFVSNNPKQHKSPLSQNTLILLGHHLALGMLQHHRKHFRVHRPTQHPSCRKHGHSKHCRVQKPQGLHLDTHEISFQCPTHLQAKPEHLQVQLR